MQEGERATHVIHTDRFSFVVARGIDDIMMAIAIRASVFMAEQSCSYREEFDGNDFCALHVIALQDGEPAATLRLRFFGDFAKMERVAVRREFRGSGIADAMVGHALALVRRKGYTRVYGHAREGLERFWSRSMRRWGSCTPVPDVSPISFSGLRFTPMSLSMSRDPMALDAESDAEILNRPEGAWDEPGVLEAGMVAK